VLNVKKYGTTVAKRRKKQENRVGKTRKEKESEKLARKCEKFAIADKVP